MSELTLPSAWNADGMQDEGCSLDESFAHVLGQHMTGLLTPEEAVTEWGRACDQEARAVYNLSQHYDYPSRVRYEEEARELRDECDTWSLMAHMFSREDTVAGPCPVVLDISTTSGYGRIITVKQHLLALTSEHADLRRVAQILAWLEDLSLQDMMRASPGQIADSLDEFGTTAGYTRQEAIQYLLASIHPSELSSHDPDANTWQAGAAIADHRCITEDEQLLSAMYTLLRAGAEPLAMNLCTKAACGWRAAAMCAAGWGLLPVGSADSTVQSRQTAIAADVLACQNRLNDVGYVAAVCAMRDRWRSACAAAAASAAQRTGVGSAVAVAAGYERALYGILSGSEEHCQGACTTWQDRLWVRGRSVLQSEPERRLREDAEARSAQSMATPQKARSWHQRLWEDVPAELADAPDASKRGSVPDQIVSAAEGGSQINCVQVMLDELEAEEGANTRFHHSLQRVLVKAAFAPMMLTELSEHPLRIVLQKLLAVRELPATSASITHHRIRFATHLGLALVSLGAMPGSPEDMDRLWQTFSDSLLGWLLEAVNHTTDEYISALTDGPKAISRELLPQYICLLRPSLTNVTLRRCFTALMPSPHVGDYRRAQAATEGLMNLQISQVDGMMVAQPPAAGCFESVLSPEAWHESSILLDALLHWFEMWHQDAPGAPGPTGVPHLPRTTVRFDAVLCETVRAAVHSNAISNVDRISMVKWLLLPYQMRKDRLEPFSGGSGETAQASWVCTVQAVFVAVDICRQSALCGMAQQYAAFRLLQHILGDTYTSHFSSGAQKTTDEDINPASQRTLLDAVSARCELQETGEESQLLVALQRAINELEEWHEALSGMDQLARFSRAVAVAASDVFVWPSVAEALSAAAAVGSRELLHGVCYVPSQFTGDVGIEMCVCAHRGSGDNAQMPVNIWGSSTAIDAAEGMSSHDAHALASNIAAALNARLCSPATWQARGLNGAIQDAIDVHAAAEPLQNVVGESDVHQPAAVRVRVTLSGLQVGAAASFERSVADTFTVCLDVVTSAIADLLRGDLLELDNAANLQVLSACALAPLDTWESSVLAHVEDWSCGIHAAHVHGDTLGRFSILRALSGRMMLAGLALESSRLQLWAAQLGINSATLSDVWDVCVSLEGCGLCSSERALDIMSTSQLRELLANAELTMLHDASATGLHM